MRTSQPPSSNQAAAAPATDRAPAAARRKRDADAVAPEDALHGIAELAAQVSGASCALLNLAPGSPPASQERFGHGATELPQDSSLWSHPSCGHEPVVIGDLQRSPLWRKDAAVTGSPHVRFYAAFPLRSASGQVHGKLCVFDSAPRRLSPKQRRALGLVARQAVAHLELRQANAQLTAARAQSQDALRKSDERFQQFMDNGPAMAYLKDDEGRFVYVSERLARRFERPAADWLGKTDADIVGSAPASGVVEHDLQVLNEERPITFEEVVPTPDGRARYWLSYKFPLRDGDRRQVGGLSLDITERKQAEHERERLVSDLQQALAQVKTLSGFLPICASCKNIRRDEGYWQQIESYLCEHAEVEFTHGICPACIEKLYPEFAAYQLQQSACPLAAQDGPG